KPNQRTSALMDSTYSTLSLVGLVSSKRRWQRPPNSSARPKFRQIDLAWPMWRYPLGSGGKRVTTRPPQRLTRTSSATRVRMKLAVRVGSLIGSIVSRAFVGRPGAGASLGDPERALHDRAHAVCGVDGTTEPSQAAMSRISSAHTACGIE